MKKELIEFIEKNNLSLFNSIKTQISSTQKSIYETKDAKAIHTKVLGKISQNFVFSDTSNLLNHFNFTQDISQIKIRQEFFRRIKDSGKMENSFLKELFIPRPNWKPDYDITIVTENTDTFNKLKEMNCPAQLLISQTDVSLLESKDVVQVLNCDEFGLVLESLPQAVFLRSINEAYLERHLEQLSGWKNNLKVLSENQLNNSINEILNQLMPLLRFTDKNETKIITKDEVERKVDEINAEITEKIKQLTISGESLIQMMSKGVLPENFKRAVLDSIEKRNLPVEIIEVGIPVKIDEFELDRLIQKQSANEFSQKAEGIKEYANEIKEIPTKIEQLKKELIVFDFICGISKFIKEESIFPKNSDEFLMKNSKNIFLDNAQPVSFYLNQEHKCSILTGANSGGKTTLIEHIIQLISLFQLGLPVLGEINIPLFTEVYYFAKNKGSLNKGAFETLLTQMSTISPGNKTLILADEIESVTEPGVAGNIIAATAQYYLNKNCYLIVATHLGHEIQKVLPNGARIDGIEAKGLTKDFELIVDHNPVLGRLANSTPELIVEKMSGSNNNEYFNYLNNYLKKKN